MTRERRYGLSKSKIAAFEQCPRRLWLQTHHPEQAHFDDGAEARFAAGNEVGDLARRLIADGVLVDDDDLGAALATTRRLLAEPPRPLFAATFQHDCVLVRVDVLSPDGSGAWHVAEVKSSTSAKDTHLRDLATQVWVIEASGLPIATVAIRHLDRDFVLEVAGRYDGLFADSDLTTAVRPIVTARPALVASARAMLDSAEPACEPGPQCHAPYECEFQAWCGRDAVNGLEWGIDLLPRTGARQAENWASRGIFDLRDLPEEAGLSQLHERIRRATVSGAPFVDHAAIRAATAAWSYPRIWIDFETITFAVPRWIGTSPWQQVPFQFSAHVEAADGSIAHVEALDLSGGDPRARDRRTSRHTAARGNADRLECLLREALLPRTGGSRPRARGRPARFRTAHRRPAASRTQPLLPLRPTRQLVDQGRVADAGAGARLRRARGEGRDKCATRLPGGDRARLLSGAPSRDRNGTARLLRP